MKISFKNYVNLKSKMLKKTEHVNRTQLFYYIIFLIAIKKMAIMDIKNEKIFKKNIGKMCTIIFYFSLLDLVCPPYFCLNMFLSFFCLH